MITTPRQRPLLAVLLPLFIFASYLCLTSLPDLRLAVPELLAASALITVALALGLWAVETGMLRWSPATILWVAFAVRLLFILRPLELSDDLYRYLWDGLHTLSGSNPYTLAPARAALPLPPSMAELLPRINHPHLVTVYPPAAQWIFAAGAALGGGVLGLKALLVMIDLGTCALLLRLSQRLGLPAERATLYAWHPLPVLEIAASGHVDGVGIAAFLCTLWLLTGNRRRVGPGVAGTALGVSVLVKLFPLLWAPAALWLTRNRRRYVLGFLFAVGLLSAPFLPQWLRAWSTLFTYVRDWEFSAFLFRTLRTLLGSGTAARLILGTTMALASGTIYVRLWMNRRGPSGVIREPSVMRALKACYLLTFWFLLLTPTLHPWYALYLVVLLPFVPDPGGIVFSWAVLLAYRVLIPYTLLGQWLEQDGTASLIWLSAVLAQLASLWAQKRRPQAGHGFAADHP